MTREPGMYSEYNTALGRSFRRRPEWIVKQRLAGVVKLISPSGGQIVGQYSPALLAGNRPYVSGQRR